MQRQGMSLLPDKQFLEVAHTPESADRLTNRLPIRRPGQHSSANRPQHSRTPPEKLVANKLQSLRLPASVLWMPARAPPILPPRLWPGTRISNRQKAAG